MQCIAQRDATSISDGIFFLGASEETVGWLNHVSLTSPCRFHSQEHFACIHSILESPTHCHLKRKKYSVLGNSQMQFFVQISAFIVSERKEEGRSIWGFPILDCVLHAQCLARDDYFNLLYWDNFLTMVKFLAKHRKNCECCPGHYLSTSVY